MSPLRHRYGSHPGVVVHDAARMTRSSLGFTLIEVVVALAIVATALLACLRAMGTMTQSGRDLDLRLLAQLSAQNRIAVLRAARQFPLTGATSEPCSQGRVALVCSQDTETTPNPAFRRVTVRVRAADDPAMVLAELTGILPRDR